MNNASNPPQSLRDFLMQCERVGQLTRLSATADTRLEITEITDRVSKGPSAQNKALLFENVTSDFGPSTMPLLINALGSQERMLLALGATCYEDIQARIESFIKPPKATGLLDKLSLLPKLAEAGQFFPKTIAKAPCQEVVIRVNDTHQASGTDLLNALPILTCWPQDGGPFITMPVVITKDGETGQRNLGMYRMQRYDNLTTGMHWHKHHDGNRLYENARRAGKDRVEVAVALGAPPHVMYAATAPLPPSIDELIFAGFLHSKPVELVKCLTVDLEVPAHSEIILEGYVPIAERRTEGPFGDHTGVYSLADEYPVFHLTAITHRKNPIYATTIVGKPPQEDCYMGKATERIFLPLLKLFISEIVDMNLPWEGVFHNCIIVSIDKRYPGHAKKVMNAIWGFGQLMFSKYVLVVDAHVNVQNLSEVAWHVLNHTDPKRDMLLTEGPLDVLDHAAPMWGYGSKLGLDATQKWPTEGYNRQWPDEMLMDNDIQTQVTQRWHEWFSNV